MIVESERRWADWQGGQPIELPDGQTWFFYQPAALTRGGQPGWTFDAPPDVDAVLSSRLSRVVAKWGRAADDAERACAVLEAGWFLLARNYAITAAEFEGMLAGASAWDEARQRQFGEQILMLVGVACMRASGLAEVG